jgi:hypothetical protein
VGTRFRRGKSDRAGRGEIRKTNKPCPFFRLQPVPMPPLFPQRHFVPFLPLPAERTNMKKARTTCGNHAKPKKRGCNTRMPQTLLQSYKTKSDTSSAALASAAALIAGSASFASHFIYFSLWALFRISFGGTTLHASPSVYEGTDASGETSKVQQSIGAPAVDGRWYDLLLVCCPYTCRRLLRWRRIETQGAQLG